MPGPVSTGMGDRVWGLTPGAGNLCQYLTSHQGQLSLAIPPWVGAMSTSQRAVSTSQRALMLCGCEAKAGMVRVWVCDPLARYLSALEMRFVIKRYTNRPHFSLLTSGLAL